MYNYIFVINTVYLTIQENRKVKGVIILNNTCMGDQQPCMILLSNLKLTDHEIQAQVQ